MIHLLFRFPMLTKIDHSTIHGRFDRPFKNRQSNTFFQHGYPVEGLRIESTIEICADILRQDGF